MATTKKRINISVSKELDEVLERLATRDQMPQATKAEHLLRLAVEIEEDEVFEAIVREREAKKGKIIPHALAWR